MKKLISLAVVALFLVPLLAFSQEQSSESDTSMGMGQQMMIGSGKMKQQDKGCRCGEGSCGCCNCMMNKKQIVATSDGGVVVLVGKVLLRYDKSLKLVKEAKVEEGSEYMKEMKNKWMEKCPKGKEKMIIQGEVEE